MTVGFVHIRGGGGTNAYLANNISEFVQLTEDILENRLPSLVENGYEVVRSRSFAQTGRQLAEAYKRAMQLHGKNLP